MGRKKRRRLRDRGMEPGTAVETVEFDIDPGPEAEPRPMEAEVPGQADSLAHGAMRPASLVETELPEDAAATPEIDKAPVTSDPSQDVQTLGELLQQAREDRGLSLEAASARTRISTLMLRHLENDRFGEFDADAYVKGFLRNYGGFLGLDVGMLLRRYEAISGRLVERDPEILELDTQPRPRSRKRFRRMGWVALAAILIAGLAWIFWSRGAAQLGLRPQPGLEQIEAELRDRARPLTVPGLVPTEPAILLPEAGPPLVSEPGPPAQPASKDPASQAPAPSPATQPPAAATERRREPQVPTPPPAPEPVEDLAPLEDPDDGAKPPESPTG